jgi:hypothetical protein
MGGFQSRGRDYSAHKIEKTTYDVFKHSMASQMRKGPVSYINRKLQERGPKVTLDDSEIRNIYSGYFGVDPKHLESVGVEIPDWTKNATLDSINQHAYDHSMEIRDKQAIARASSDAHAGIAGFLGTMAGDAADAISFGTMFLPVVSQASTLRMAGKSGATLARARTGFLEGLAGAAMMEPTQGAQEKWLGNEYTMADSLTNVALGATMSMGIHVGGGTAGDLVSKAFGKKTLAEQGQELLMRERNQKNYDEGLNFDGEPDIRTLNIPEELGAEIRNVAEKIDNRTRESYGHAPDEKGNSVSWEAARIRMVEALDGWANGRTPDMELYGVIHQVQTALKNKTMTISEAERVIREAYKKHKGALLDPSRETVFKGFESKWTRGGKDVFDVDEKASVVKGQEDAALAIPDSEIEEGVKNNNRAAKNVADADNLAARAQKARDGVDKPKDAPEPSPEAEASPPKKTTKNVPNKLGALAEAEEKVRVIGEEREQIRVTQEKAAKQQRLDKNTLARKKEKLKKEIKARRELAEEEALARENKGLAPKESGPAVKPKEKSKATKATKATPEEASPMVVAAEEVVAAAEQSSKSAETDAALARQNRKAQERQNKANRELREEQNKKRARDEAALRSQGVLNDSNMGKRPDLRHPDNVGGGDKGGETPWSKSLNSGVIDEKSKRAPLEQAEVVSPLDKNTISKKKPVNEDGVRLYTREEVVDGYPRGMTVKEIDAELKNIGLKGHSGKSRAGKMAALDEYHKRTRAQEIKARETPGTFRLEDMSNTDRKRRLKQEAKDIKKREELAMATQRVETMETIKLIKEERLKDDAERKAAFELQKAKRELDRIKYVEERRAAGVEDPVYEPSSADWAAYMAPPVDKLPVFRWAGKDLAPLYDLSDAIDAVSVCRLPMTPNVGPKNKTGFGTVAPKPDYKNPLAGRRGTIGPEVRDRTYPEYHMEELNQVFYDIVEGDVPISVRPLTEQDGIDHGYLATNRTPEEVLRMEPEAEWNERGYTAENFNDETGGDFIGISQDELFTMEARRLAIEDLERSNVRYDSRYKPEVPPKEKVITYMPMAEIDGGAQHPNYNMRTLNREIQAATEQANYNIGNTIRRDYFAPHTRDMQEQRIARYDAHEAEKPIDRAKQLNPIRTVEDKETFNKTVGKAYWTYVNRVKPSLIERGGKAGLETFKLREEVARSKLFSSLEEYNDGSLPSWFFNDRALVELDGPLATEVGFRMDIEPRIREVYNRAHHQVVNDIDAAWTKFNESESVRMSALSEIEEAIGSKEFHPVEKEGMEKVRDILSRSVPQQLSFKNVSQLKDMYTTLGVPLPKDKRKSSLLENIQGPLENKRQEYIDVMTSVELTFEQGKRRAKEIKRINQKDVDYEWSKFNSFMEDISKADVLEVIETPKLKLNRQEPSGDNK